MKLISTPYYCPKCKEKLNLQWDFDPSKKFWKCVECGTWLEHEEEAAAYLIYKGENPGDVPVKETESDIEDMDDDEQRSAEAIARYESVLEEEEKAPDPTRKKGWTWPFGKKKEDLEDEFEEDVIPEEVDTDWNKEIGKEKKPSKLVRFCKHIFKYRKIYLIILVIVAALTVGYTIYHHLAKMATVGISDEQAAGMTYEEVVKILENAGYTNIETIPLEDLQSKNMNKENFVDMISIGGDNDFTETDRFEYDSEVVIQYHSAKMIKMPIDPKKVNEKSVKEMENLLRKAGFEKITMEADYDLIFGVLHKEGDVEKITVDGSTKFTELQAYRIDTEIVITYHDFKKNNTSK